MSTPITAPVVAPLPKASRWQDKFAYLAHQVRRSPLTMAGLLITLMVLLVMIFAPWLASHDPNSLNLTQRLAAPSAAHWFGTDEVGRDLFSRVLYGSRQSVGVGLFVAFASCFAGGLLGCMSGIIGGRFDGLIMRLMDIMLSVPSLVLIMALAAALGPSLFNAMLAITLVRIPFYVRLARGQALSIRQMGYVKAAETFGAGRWHMVLWHVARNAMPPLLVQLSLDIGSAILMASALGFIGLGAQQPTAEWGAMVATGRNYILDQWWYSTFPGVAILITATGFNLLGDGVRDLLDPRQQGEMTMHVSSQQPPADASPVLVIDDLTIEFPAYKSTVKALNGVSLHVNPGEIVGVIGESGSGKSVTAMLSLRLLPERAYEVKSGSLSILGRDMLTARETDLLKVRGRDAAMIFQEPMTALNPTRRIGRQMLDVIIHHQQLSKAEAKAKAISLLRDMHIADPEQVMNSYPFELSGGMRQRVMIALAFSCDPQLLIADEPTTALDVTVQRQVLLLLREKARQRGTAILLITHDMALVSQFCDRVYVMYTGAVVEQGLTAQVMADPRHPYTKGLLSGLPEQVEPGQDLMTIPGQVPNLSALPEGCTFRERCAFAMPKCLQRPPMQTIDAAADRKSACWLSAPSYAPAQESLS